MAASRLAPAIAALAFIVSPTLAIYIRVEVEKVPIERIAKNLEETIKNEPKNAKAVLNLARAHAMAYSLRSNELPVNAKEPNKVWFDYEPPIVPFNKVAKTDDREKITAARVHLDKAIALYEKAVKLDPKDLHARLGHAWLLSQTDKKNEAIAALRKVIDDAWMKEKDLMALGLGGHTVTAEGADYLIPLLDKDKDRDEIATLKERADKLKKLPRPITPIAVPLKPGLTARDIEDRAAAVAFDADGTGLKKKWSWITKDAAWLVHDPQGSGKVDSALQMFGNVTFWMFWDSGYEALVALDDNRDGKLAGDELAGLALWHDANGNGISEEGEVKPVRDHGIITISCRCQRDTSHPDNIAYSPQGVTFKGCASRATYDVVLHPVK